MDFIIGLLIVALGACLFIKSLKCLFRVIIGIALISLAIYFVFGILV